MSDSLRPRPGPAPRLIEGPSAGQRSLYAQHVLDEDTYTEALSHIIQRDFFPTLPHLHATNDYLSALANNDPELLSSSIRRLARIAAEKEDRGRAAHARGARGGDSTRRRARSDSPEQRREHAGERERIRREFDAAHTPYMSVGARGWDTPRTERRDADDDDDDDESGTPKSKRRRKDAAPAAPRIRDDLSLDAFQRNYTSEDNASFAQIVDEENQRRRAERPWAWAAERVAEDKRLAWEDKRRLLLDAATGGGWRVDAAGRRLIGGLDEGARADEEAWRERKMIAAAESEPGSSEDAPSMALTVAGASGSGSGALIKHISAAAASALPPPTIREEALPADHPLSRALEAAGLPTTALVSTADGAIVPQHEAAHGAGDGRGRGAGERAAQDAVDARVMADEAREETGESTQQWKYKAMNGLMFLPDANEEPYPKPPPKATDPKRKLVANPPSIAYRNTRIPDEDDDRGTAAGSTVRGSSPARSWVDAAVKGTEYVPREERTALVPTEADLDPEDLPPLMTWGTLLATPRRLDGSDAGSAAGELDGPAFRLPEPKKRDDLGRKLGARAGRAIADRARSYAPPAASAPPQGTPKLSDALRAAANRTRSGDRSVRAPMLPPSTPRREGNLTPAARSLLDRSLGRTPQRSGGGLGLGAGASARGAAMDRGAGWGGAAKGASKSRSWTPSPAPRR